MPGLDPGIHEQKGGREAALSHLGRAMRNPFKLWWRHVRGPCYRVLGRSKLFILRLRHRLCTRLKTLSSQALQVKVTVKLYTKRALHSLRIQRKKTFDGARRHWAQFDRRLIRLRYEIQGRITKHSKAIIGTLMVVAPAVSLWFAPLLQNAVGAYFTAERFAVLRSLLASTGGALIGATAIGFSVVMIAVQLNFARMPHGLFRRLSSDARLLGAF